jgi:dihydroxyacetone kinase
VCGSGDKLNFGLAAEIAKAEGYAVEMVVVADDVALLDTQHSIGARGIAGTVLVHKIVGAAAESGASLQSVVELARSVARGMFLTLIHSLSLTSLFKMMNVDFLILCEDFV